VVNALGYAWRETRGRALVVVDYNDDHGYQGG
jgi:hypothetical protein